MAGPERKRFENADETRAFEDKGQVEIVNVGDGVVGRAQHLSRAGSGPIM